MVAGLVLVVLFLSALAALQSGFRMLDTARNTTLAGQILQSEIEDLRLQAWTKIAAYPVGAPVAIDLAASIGKHLDSGEAAALAQRFSATRTVADVPDRAGNLKRVTIALSWRDYAGTLHTRSYETLLGHFGLSDYFVTTHTASP